MRIVIALLASLLLHPSGAAAAAPLPAGLTRLPPGTFQLLVVTAAGYGGSSARLTAYAEINGQWRVVFPGMPARIGARGFSDHKHEGDRTTPTGIYPFGPTVYGLAPTPASSSPTTARPRRLLERERRIARLQHVHARHRTRAARARRCGGSRRSTTSSRSSSTTCRPFPAAAVACFSRDGARPRDRRLRRARPWRPGEDPDLAAPRGPARASRSGHRPVTFWRDLTVPFRHGAFPPLGGVPDRSSGSGRG